MLWLFCLRARDEWLYKYAAQPKRQKSTRQIKLINPREWLFLLKYKLISAVARIAAAGEGAGLMLLLYTTSTYLPSQRERSVLYTCVYSVFLLIEYKSYAEMAYNL